MSIFRVTPAVPHRVETTVIPGTPEVKKIQVGQYHVSHHEGCQAGFLVKHVDLQDIAFPRVKISIPDQTTGAGGLREFAEMFNEMADVLDGTHAKQAAAELELTDELLCECDEDDCVELELTEDELLCEYQLLQLGDRLQPGDECRCKLEDGIPCGGWVRSVQAEDSLVISDTMHPLFQFRRPTYRQLEAHEIIREGDEYASLNEPAEFLSVLHVELGRLVGDCQCLYCDPTQGIKYSYRRPLKNETQVKR
jgi:hypothetical protein